MNIIYGIIYATISNFYIINNNFNFKILWSISIILAIIINIFPSVFSKKLEDEKLKKIRKGKDLLIIFLISIGISILFYILGYMLKVLSLDLKIFLLNLLFVFLFELVIFWNGIIRLYIYSNQLGLKWRLIGLVAGMIPIVHLFVLVRIIYIVSIEIKYENNKFLLNKERKSEKICKTKYPILLVHGVFFRDYAYFNYWGRIPEELIKNGATIFYGNHQSAASIKDSGKELANRIKEILKETGCGKVNIIAHSKGGLDSRYTISKLGMDKYVASLTTINSPHRGCEFADYLLGKINTSIIDTIADKYNNTLKHFGDTNPDFKSAVYDLTRDSAVKMNREIIDSPKVYYQSIGSKLNVSRGGRFPLNLTSKFVKLFDGDNDGLVGYKSFQWGSNYEYLTVKGSRGISHGDLIDLNRENIDEFDVREYYVQLVKKLKDKGF